MIRTADLPLHFGHCPSWLFGKMTRLGAAISETIMQEQGQEEFIERISNPYFFQALSCVLGFDWHSSGTTTTMLGALKAAFTEKEIGIKICGGKGKVARKTPSEIEINAEKLNIPTARANSLIYASRMSAKVDGAMIQDGYNIYAHFIIISEKNKYAIIQQGMNPKIRYARRYHWIEGFEKFTEEPHKAICCDKKEKEALDLTAKQSSETKKASVDLVKGNTKNLEKDFNEALHMTRNHRNLHLSTKSLNYLKKAYEFQPENYEELISIQGIGPASVRALALISEIVYGTRTSWEDPAKFSYTLGGKDKVPYEIDKNRYDKTIEMINSAVRNAKIGDKEKINAIKKLGEYVNLIR